MGSARALRWTPLADISGQIREHGILFKLWRDFQCCLVTVDRKSWAINYDDAAENKMEKIGCQMAATTMTTATTFMLGWWQPWSVRNPFAHWTAHRIPIQIFPGRNAEPWTWSLPSCLRGHPPPTPPPHFTYSRPHIRFRSTLFRCGVRKTMGAGFVDSYFDLCEIVVGVLRPKLRVKGAKMGPAAEGAWCMRPRGLQKKGNK